MIPDQHWSLVLAFCSAFFIVLRTRLCTVHVPSLRVSAIIVGLKLGREASALSSKHALFGVLDGGKEG
jgi:hypothetical protein